MFPFTTRTDDIKKWMTKYENTVVSFNVDETHTSVYMNSLSHYAISSAQDML